MQIKVEAAEAATASKAAAEAAAEVAELRKTLSGVREALAATKRKVREVTFLGVLFGVSV